MSAGDWRRPADDWRDPYRLYHLARPGETPIVLVEVCPPDQSFARMRPGIDPDLSDRPHP